MNRNQIDALAEQLNLPPDVVKQPHVQRQLGSLSDREVNVFLGGIAEGVKFAHEESGATTIEHITETQMTIESIQEFVDSRGVALRVDRERGVIRGVKLLGRESANGRHYPQATIAAAAHLYEDAKVNVDHPQGGGFSAKPQRNYADRIGVIRNVQAGDGGLRGDLHANPKHALFEQLAWDAENSPGSVGLSHNVEAKTTRRRDGTTVVEEIIRVHSVDLVSDPATTSGLFESAAGDAEKQAMVNTVAGQINLPPLAIPALDGGLQYRHTEPEIREYLTNHKQSLQQSGHLPRVTPRPLAVDLGRTPSGAPANVAEFAAGATDGLTESDRSRFPSLVKPSINGHAAGWLA